MKNLERQEKEQIQGRTNRRRPIFNSTIQLVVVNLYTKFEVSILNGCGDIFDEKSGKKIKEEKNKQEKAHFQSHKIQRVIVNPYTKFEVSILNGCGDIFEEKSGETEKGQKYREEQKGEGPISIPQNTTCRCEPVAQI